MKIVSWNVNSINARLSRVLAFLARERPDLLCIQETKCNEAKFPFEAIREAGYEVSLYGMPAYNGVCFLYRKDGPGLSEVEQGFEGDPVPHETRVQAADFAGIRVINAYVVNGEAPGTEKFARKMVWLLAFRDHIDTHRAAGHPTLVVGDFNIAPEDIDVYDPVAWKDHIHCTPQEREHTAAIVAAGWIDLHRQVTSEQVFTWWHYRNFAFQKGMGLRIDLGFGTEDLARRIRSVRVDRDERKESSGEGKPSDHAPVIFEFADA